MLEPLIVEVKEVNEHLEDFDCEQLRHGSLLRLACIELVGSRPALGSTHAVFVAGMHQDGLHDDDLLQS